MRTFSYLTLPLLAAALLYANTSDALFDGLKNTITRSFVCAAGLSNTNNNTPSNTTKPIKPFVSGKEKKAAFRKLIALESGMAGIIDYEDFGITQAIYDIELSRHRETLMLFFQRLFRSIVKKAYIEQPCQDKKIILHFIKETDFIIKAREAFDEDYHKTHRSFWPPGRENERLGF